MQLGSTVWWKNGRIVKNVNQKLSGSEEASNGVVCGSEHVSVSVMRKKH